MIDLDALHAWAQFPVAAVEMTVALAMIYRWRWALRSPHQLDHTLTLLLAVFIGVIAVKQGFWAVWGALQAADLIHAADTVRTHVWPIINNVLITFCGLVVLARICGARLGVIGYAGAAMVGVVVYGLAWML